ncbi:hypothetical protein [Paracraurococcus ruber]|uniref:Uncharacterized protein n=1 Tax=Paracraurococcus ruber TaxID=77675 RepID=A0ABS1CRN6_9PROT|nr:hypothetical protein [Paracraurococcus ruber]MBK1657116.1 hypothetical protein [Paracraurococcus ruber]TDG31713.1 hypothetical protein E2C05_10040 [Paracraurococcus ruber]
MSGAARTRQTPKARPAPRGPRASLARAAGGPLAGWRRWRWIGILVLAALIGLPLAHAILGEVAALLGAVFLLGFLLGRWTGR